MKNLLGLLVLLLLLVSCRYPREEGQISALKENTNLEVFADSVALERLPIEMALVPVADAWLPRATARSALAVV